MKAPVKVSEPGVPYIPKNLFIRRPILSSVISIVIVLLGLFSMKGLPIASYPMITPPSVSVSAFYPGATASDVAEAVAAPIEQQLSGIQDLLYYTSANGSDGTMNLSVFFNIERNQDLAAVDVQNQVKLAEPQLPQEVRQNGITVKKAQKDILLMVAVRSDDPRYDAEYLSNFLKINVEDELKKLNGVGDATVYGQLEFSMLISLDPYRMAQLHVSVPEIVGAIREQNTPTPVAGSGVSRHRRGPTSRCRSRRRAASPTRRSTSRSSSGPTGRAACCASVTSAACGSGPQLRLLGRLNGKATAIIPVYLRSGGERARVREAIAHDSRSSEAISRRASLPTSCTTRRRSSTASIEEVLKTLVEAMSWCSWWCSSSCRAGAPPSSRCSPCRCPSSARSSACRCSGFSINTLTLFGLVLAIGIVVDDAIVVVENVERIMAERHGAAQAADEAMAEVSGALIAIVLVLCAVFVPVAFLGGSPGVLYKQFALTIAVSVVHLGRRGADADAGALRRAPQAAPAGAREERLLRGVQPGLRPRDGGYCRDRKRRWACPRPCSPCSSDGGALVVLFKVLPGGLRAVRGQGLLRRRRQVRTRRSLSARTRWSAGREASSRIRR